MKPDDREVAVWRTLDQIASECGVRGNITILRERLSSRLDTDYAAGGPRAVQLKAAVLLCLREAVSALEAWDASFVEGRVVQ